MSRFLDFLRHTFRIKSPSLQKAEQYALYKPPEWERIRQQALEKAKADTSAVDQMRAYALPVMPEKIPMPKSDGMNIAASFLDEVHEITRPPVTLYAENHPIITFRPDSIDAFCTALRRIGEAAAEAVAALGAMVRATGDADLIACYGTDKEIHYITHARKARTRKKYRNRVLRRARCDERRSRNEKNRVPRA
ncbi:MAG: hypothetical protein IKK75_07485 [Clostridia bacterium]|nr:hypothetical protein [Clostridia bacterium]